MAVRTTSPLVQGVLIGDYGNGADLTPFMLSASVTVDRVVLGATAKGITLSSTELELIERWLAAHYYAVSDRPYKSKSTAGASASFDGNTVMYLEATLYGQTAMRLDRSGVLDNIGGPVRKVAGGFWLGKKEGDAKSYDDRNF